MKVSVIIPTYNRGSKIRETLDSVLCQTFTPFEILVVDDGSTDGTADWIEAHYGSKICLLRQLNSGVANARNHGVQEAKGDWLAFLDHDDIFHHQKLEKLVDLANEGVGVIVPRWREVGETEKDSPIVKPSDTFKWLFGWNNPIVSMSVPIIRRDLLIQIGSFDPLCVPADDWDVWLRLAKISRFSFSDEILVDYSVHSGQQRLDEQKMFRAVRRVLRKHPFELAKRPLLLWWFLSSSAFFATSVEHKKFKAGETSALFKAMTKNPMAMLTPQWVLLFARKLLRRV